MWVYMRCDLIWCDMVYRVRYTSNHLTSTRTNHIHEQQIPRYTKRCVIIVHVMQRAHSHQTGLWLVPGASIMDIHHSSCPFPLGKPTADRVLEGRPRLFFVCFNKTNTTVDVGIPWVWVICCVQAVKYKTHTHTQTPTHIPYRVRL